MGIDPVSLAVVGAAGAGLNAYGSYESGQSQAAAASYQAQIAANNAITAQQNAKWDIQSGDIAATNEELKTRAQIGTAKANQGASGIDVNTGSSADVRSGMAETGTANALTQRSDAAKKAYSAQVEAVSDTAQSKLDTMQATQAQEAGEIGGLGSLLSGASTVGGNYAKWKNSAG